MALWTWLWKDTVTKNIVDDITFQDGRHYFCIYSDVEEKKCCRRAIISTSYHFYMASSISYFPLAYKAEAKGQRKHCSNCYYFTRWRSTALKVRHLYQYLYVASLANVLAKPFNTYLTTYVHSVTLRIGRSYLVLTYRCAIFCSPANYHIPHLPY